MEQLADKYRNDYALFDSFTQRLQQLFETILTNSEITYHLVESRTKSVDSLCEKVNLKQGKYSDPLKEITDICALRIIVYYIDDLEKIEKLLRENFIIDEANSYDAKNNMTDNEFGYLSSHFVILLKNDRSKLLEWLPYKELKAEIQVRTVLQHAWAAISHQLEYKKNYDIPSILKRKLFRLAGLIELADEEFQEAREKHHDVEIAVKDNKSLNNLKVFEEINLITLKNYFSDESNKSLKIIDKQAEEAGFDFIKNEDFSQRERNEFLSDIIKISKILGIKTTSDFDKTLHELEKSAFTRLDRLFKLHNVGWTVSTEFVVLLLFCTLLSTSQLDEYDNKMWDDKLWKLFRSMSKGE